MKEKNSFKFRVWDKHDNSWVNYPVYIDSDGEVYWEHHERGLQEDSGLVISQSTGLKDKNGVDIYEDDIVKMQWRVYDEPELFVVKTKSGRAARVDNRTKGTELWLRHHHCDVVGNVWEHPELMEGFE